MLLSILIHVVLVQTHVVSPGVRNAHAAAYDPCDSSLVLFGGATADEVRGDTWRWKNGSWLRISITGPDPRTFPAMAYDSARAEIVLFGGNRVLFGDSTNPARMLGDTWVLRGNTWVRQSVEGPAPRAEASVAYDAARQRTVLFGGRYDSAGQTIRLGDTWEWDGKKWLQMSTSGPALRSGAAMAFDPVRRKVLLFGGSDGPRGDTWVWNGHDWAVLPVPLASGRFNTVMAWDPLLRRMVRFSGWDGKTRPADTWELRNQGWVRVPDDGPSGRNHAAMVSAADRGSLLLYGGHDGDRVFGDMWERRNGRWVRLESAVPVRRVENGH